MDASDFEERQITAKPTTVPYIETVYITVTASPVASPQVIPNPKRFGPRSNGQGQEHMRLWQTIDRADFPGGNKMTV